MPKTVLCETLLCTMRGIEIFQNQSYREISPMWGSLMRGLPVLSCSEFNNKIVILPDRVLPRTKQTIWNSIKNVKSNNALLFSYPYPSARN